MSEYNRCFAQRSDGKRCLLADSGETAKFKEVFYRTSKHGAHACQVVALAELLQTSELNALELLSRFEYTLADPGSEFSHILDILGYDRVSVPKVKKGKPFTVDSVCVKGAVIARCHDESDPPHCFHVCCVRNGVVLDAWDSRECELTDIFVHPKHLRYRRKEKSNGKERPESQQPSAERP